MELQDLANSFDIREILQKKVDEQLGPIIEEKLRKSFFPKLDVYVEDIKNKLGFTPEAARILMNLASESGNPASDVLIRALGLYKIALDAKKEGNRIAIVDQDWDAVQEITGIDFARPEKQEVRHSSPLHD